MKSEPPRFENPLQLGGIRLGTLEERGQPVRTAFFDTGSGLRFTVALDRGGDITDARFNAHNLAYLSPVGLVPPSHAHHSGAEWLQGWAGGLVTTCGPHYIGCPREEDGTAVSLHGHYSNTPATVESVWNPDPRRGILDMSLGLLIRVTRVFGPSFEIRRNISCKLGEPEVIIRDEVWNHGDTTVAHNWLYHCNLGYPLLDEGARFVYRGRAMHWQLPAPKGESLLQPIPAAAMNRLKRVPAPMAEHAGGVERGLIVDVESDRKGVCWIGLVNPRLKLGLEIAYPSKALPRMANWQHYGPRGCYVSALEPFHGSLLGKALDKSPLAKQQLKPGQSRYYELKLRVLSGSSEVRAFDACDGPVLS